MAYVKGRVFLLDMKYLMHNTYGTAINRHIGYLNMFLCWMALQAALITYRNVIKSNTIVPREGEEEMIT